VGWHGRSRHRVDTCRRSSCWRTSHTLHDAWRRRNDTTPRDRYTHSLPYRPTTLLLSSVLSPVYTIQPVVKPVVQPGLTTGCIHDTAVCQGLNVCIHDTTGCETGLTTPLTTGLKTHCIVYTNIYPVWQQVVSCKRGFTLTRCNRSFVAALPETAGVVQGVWNIQKPGLKCYIQGDPENWQNFLYALTSSNINRFSKLFHYQNQEKICNSTIAKDSTTPQVCRYTTLWNFKCLTSNNWKQDHFCNNTF